MERARFGAGCFWGIEKTFAEVPGVTKTLVGYAGGTTENPTYKEVCSDTTGHAEVVELWFDPTVVSYESLLEVFWKCHDPTQYNRQGPDIGSQYRSAIYFFSETQRLAALESLQQQETSGRHHNTIVTEIAPAGPFYEAEAYHQKYCFR